MRIAGRLLLATRRVAPAILTIALTAFVGPLAAQEPESREAPNEEPSAFDTLFDRSDLGNVTQTAWSHYHSGIRDLERAERIERRAAEASEPAKKEKLENKSLSAYESAVGSFQEALRYEPELQEAYAGLGTALRRLDRADEALQLHATALRRWPDDDENFRGWARSLLALNMLGNATGAYSSYAETNPARAQILMSEMKQWLAERRADPRDLDPADVERLASWISQQEQGSS